MLNIIFITFFLSAFIMAVFQSLFFGNTEIWTLLINELFTSAKSAFTISINLTGMLCLWLGLLKIAEKSGLTELLAKALRPLFRKIMPEIPDNHPAIGSMVMNIAANMLGLDNAATPMGLKAMEQMQELNKQKDTASNAQIMFMVINASAVTIVPISILMYRAELGSTTCLRKQHPPKTLRHPKFWGSTLPTAVGSGWSSPSDAGHGASESLPWRAAHHSCSPLLVPPDACSLSGLPSTLQPLWTSNRGSAIGQQPRRRRVWESTFPPLLWGSKFTK